MSRKAGNKYKDEFYPTPEYCVHRLIDGFPFKGGTFFEPAAGQGHILNHFATYPTLVDAKWFINDLYLLDAFKQNFADRAESQDFTTFKKPNHWPERFDYLVTNPPFSLAADFLTIGLGVAETVIMLLRMNWIAPNTRNHLLKNNMPHLYVLPDRPSFEEGKTDATEYAWMVWHRSAPVSVATIQLLEPTPLIERK